MDDKKKEEEPKAGDFLKEFDFYKDMPRDLAQPTLVGATMSIGVIICIGLLLLYQVVEFLSYQ